MHVLRFLFLVIAASAVLAACGSTVPATVSPRPTTQLPVADWTVHPFPGGYEKVANLAQELGSPLRDLNTEGDFLTQGYLSPLQFTFIMEGKRVTYTFNVRADNVGDMVFILYKRPNGKWGVIPLGHAVERQGQLVRFLSFSNPLTMEFSDEEKQRVFPNSGAA